MSSTDRIETKILLRAPVGRLDLTKAYPMNVRGWSGLLENIARYVRARTQS